MFSIYFYGNEGGRNCSGNMKMMFKNSNIKLDILYGYL